VAAVRQQPDPVADFQDEVGLRHQVGIAPADMGDRTTMPSGSDVSHGLPDYGAGGGEHAQIAEVRAVADNPGPGAISPINLTAAASASGAVAVAITTSSDRSTIVSSGIWFL
jgi:hypothetical protein